MENLLIDIINYKVFNGAWTNVHVFWRNAYVWKDVYHCVSKANKKQFIRWRKRQNHEIDIQLLQIVMNIVMSSDQKIISLFLNWTTTDSCDIDLTSSGKQNIQNE